MCVLWRHPEFYLRGMDMYFIFYIVNFQNNVLKANNEASVFYLYI